MTYENITKKELYEIRRLRLIELIETKYYGNKTKFAKAIGKTNTYVCFLAYPHDKAGSKNIGATILEAIYQNCDVPRGWMDKQYLNKDIALVENEPYLTKRENELISKLSDSDKMLLKKIIYTFF